MEYFSIQWECKWGGIREIKENATQTLMWLGQILHRVKNVLGDEWDCMEIIWEIAMRFSWKVPDFFNFTFFLSQSLVEKKKIGELTW